ncbi:XRE family transcriptional regulator [Rhodovulum imhoffii]|uniref:XRE family transcriptional regulator n=1 Tax=Rhodovulum imhoffii TaxID=365340 RepID=A0A2T5BVH1_9RHOB|nr:cupin domain-containing protein [Rhodovulum imhoffii]MBK5932855.1 XRE family transcriptional regulator [Rhodovulum imhoffii]PTN03576.1 XRE family transcriptional regulator [Rhodovulum imhoffii]
MHEFDVGARLRELRKSFGMSQRHLAESAGVPHGQISMIETNRSSPSVSSLRKILGGMGIGMSEFFEPDAQDSGQVFFTPGELRDLTSRIYSGAGQAQGRITLKQVGDARSHNLQILHETYDPGADTGETMLEHLASEGGIVISGEIELTVGKCRTILKAGDSYLFNSQEPHRFRNISDRPATVISACTPPYL